MYVSYQYQIRSTNSLRNSVFIVFVHFVHARVYVLKFTLFRQSDILCPNQQGHFPETLGTVVHSSWINSVWSVENSDQ